MSEMEDAKKFMFSEFAGADNAEKFNNAMAALRENPGSVLEIEPGEYEITTDLAREAVYNVMSGAWGTYPQDVMFNPKYKYSVGIDMSRQKNTTLRAYGVKLIVDGFMEVVSITDSDGVTIEGLEIDHKRRPYSVGRVANSRKLSDDEVACDVELYEGNEIMEGTPLNMRYFLYNPETERLEWPYIYDPRCKYAGPRRVTFTGKYFLEDKNIDGMEIYIWHTFHSRPAILSQRSKNTVIRDVTVRSQPGMGITGNRSENILLERFRDIPAEGMHMSTNSDATHFTACMGKLIVKDSQFIAQGDDAINVHGYYHTVKKVDGCKCTVKNECPDGTHTQTPDYPDPGDILEITENRTLAVLGTVRVIDAVCSKENHKICELLLDSPLPEDAVEKKLFLFNISKLPSLEFAGNLCKGNFARGVLAKTRNVYVHDNSFEDIMGSAVCIYAEHSWREGTISGNIRVENNVMRRCEHLDPKDSIGGIEVGNHAPEKAAQPQIKNVSITGNVIDCPLTRTAILVEGAEGLTISGNTNLGSKSTVEVLDCRDVKILQ